MFDIYFVLHIFYCVVCYIGQYTFCDPHHYMALAFCNPHKFSGIFRADHKYIQFIMMTINNDNKDDDDITYYDD